MRLHIWWWFLYLFAAFPTVSFRSPPSPRFVLKAYASKLTFEFGLLKCKPSDGTCSAGTMHSYFHESTEQKYFSEIQQSSCNIISAMTLHLLWKVKFILIGKMFNFLQCFLVRLCDLFCQSARVGCTHGMQEEPGAIFSRTIFFNSSRVWLLTTTYAVANVLFCQCNSLSDEISKWNI